MGAVPTAAAGSAQCMCGRERLGQPERRYAGTLAGRVCRTGCRCCVSPWSPAVRHVFVCEIMRSKELPVGVAGALPCRRHDAHSWPRGFGARRCCAKCYSRRARNS